MYPWYDLHSVSKQYREEALQRAQGQGHIKRALIERSPRSERPSSYRVWRSTLSLFLIRHLAQ